MQDRLLISPASFDRRIGPRIARLVDLAHAHGVRAMFHSCGAVVPLIERLIGLGVDILDPIQVRAKGDGSGLSERDVRRPDSPSTVRSIRSTCFPGGRRKTCGRTSAV